VAALGSEPAEGETARLHTRCDANPEKIACDYPDYDLDKIVSKKFADTAARPTSWSRSSSGQRGPELVARYIAQDKMTPDAAAKKWVERQPGQGQSWLPAT